MDPRFIVSSTGESIACGYLADNFYTIVERNYRTRFGEIDIVAISPDKTLVFCEVKTLQNKNTPPSNTSDSFPQNTGNDVNNLVKVRHCDMPDFSFVPEDHMSPVKIRRCFRIGEWYANNHPTLSSSGWRIDLIALVLDSRLSVVSLRHYPNIALS